MRTWRHSWTSQAVSQLQVISQTSAGDGVVDAGCEEFLHPERERRAQSTPVELAGGVPPYRSPGRSTISIQPLDAQVGFQVDVAGGAESVGGSPNCPILPLRYLTFGKERDGRMAKREKGGREPDSSHSHQQCFPMCLLPDQCDAMPKKTG